jgi:tryptophanyl-tRNA synthetase
MFPRRNLLGFVVLLILTISVSTCSRVSLEETKESKLKKKRDELVATKSEADKRRDNYRRDVKLVEDIYKACLQEESLREELKGCDKDRQGSLDVHRRWVQVADDRINEIRREIKELEQSGSANENLKANS